MSTQGLRKCCCCKSWFRPHPRKAGRQEYCGNEDCQAASKRTSQRKWCRKNPSYFRGKDEVERVQTWQQANPGRKKRGSKRLPQEPEAALQDLVMEQTVVEESFDPLRNPAWLEKLHALQELVTSQHYAMVGLASMITGEALQEEIGRTLTACYERGQRIGGKVPWMPPQENRHERTHTDSSTAPAAGSAAVQLDRPPAGP